MTTDQGLANDNDMINGILFIEAKVFDMIISIEMPSYPNVTLFLCYISEYWTTARTLDMTINHKIP